MIENSKQSSSSLDPGLATLVMLLRFQGVGVDPAQISHQFGATPIGVPEMLRCAKGFNLKANCLKTFCTILFHFVPTSCTIHSQEVLYVRR